MVGVVLLVASGVSYGLVYSTEASPAAFEAVEVGGTGIVMKQAAAPLVVMTPDRFGFIAFVDSIPDTTVLLASGVTLLALAAGVRRHTC